MSETLSELVSQLAELSAPEPDDGLSDAEWKQLFEAEQLVRTACEAAAGRRLRARLPAAQRRLGSAEDACEAAKRDAKAPEAAVKKLEAELAEAERRLAECELAGDDADLTVRIESRLVRNALEEECAALTARLARVRELSAPHLEARARAESARDAARRDLAELSAAVFDPFSTAPGRGTPEFERFLRYSGAWEDFPRTDAARRVLVSGLKFCGYYDVIVRETVEAWLDGDPEVRKASRILRDDGEVRVTLNDRNQAVAVDVRGRQRFAGQHAAAPPPGPDMLQAREGLFGDVLAGPEQ